MNAKSRSVIRAAVWLCGTAAYIAVCFFTARYFVRGMQAWAGAHGASLGFVLELQRLGTPAFVICLTCGALYASALAKPACFGQTTRIWRYLAATYILVSLGNILIVRSQFLPLPDFHSDMVTRTYLFFTFAIPIVCYLLGLLAWVRMAFGNSGDAPAAQGGPR